MSSDHPSGSGSAGHPASQSMPADIQRIWALLARGVADKRSPFNVPTVATVSTAGLPTARTVVLRDCSPSARRLTFHTDARSRKFGEIKTNATMAWHVWAPRQRLQVRLTAHATLHQRNATAEAAWAKLHSGSRALYCQPAAPLSPVDTLETGADSAPLSAAEGFANFVVVETTVAEIEWLELADGGRQKRGVAWWAAEAEHWRASWVAA